MLLKYFNSSHFISANITFYNLKGVLIIVILNTGELLWLSDNNSCLASALL